MSALYFMFNAISAIYEAPHARPSFFATVCGLMTHIIGDIKHRRLDEGIIYAR